MIIDTHAQLFTKDFVEGIKSGKIAGLDALGYERFFYGKAEPLDTVADMDEAGVDVSVIVAVDAETTADYRIPNDLVAEQVQKAPDRLIGFAGVDPHKGEAAVKEAERAVNELGFRGLKFICHLNELKPNDKKFYPIYEAAQAMNIPVLHHTGTHYHFGRKIKYCRPVYIDDVAVDFPSLSLIIAHFGWPWTEEAIAVAMRNPMVYINVAGWSPKYYPEVLVRHMNGPLKGKILFGSDHPLLSRKRIVSELADVPLSDMARANLMSENAKQLLKIS